MGQNNTSRRKTQDTNPTTERGSVTDNHIGNNNYIGEVFNEKAIVCQANDHDKKHHLSISFVQLCTVREL